ncbi:hypothetical protein B0T21DRAFT_407605 [Apiosordaria backusii]|uniref:Alpha-type protein kinase domain-containing protein n=1 Tax=Apiosordaria backusii TaxID=314023 RepID=A0AA40ES47_9PEZI|nr:hypothetical protein B0T21DRAFT_407605 [Apiosordaria backusii]
MSSALGVSQPVQMMFSISYRTPRSLVDRGYEDAWPGGHGVTRPLVGSRRSTHWLRRRLERGGRDLPQTSYTSNQWSKGLGLSRCAGCVHGHSSDTPATQQSDSGRYNDSVNATFSHDALNNPFASGAFRWVAKGGYTSGARSGQACVLKWFKTGAVFEDDYFALDIKAVDRALEIVNRFNELNIVNKTCDNIFSILLFPCGVPFRMLKT